MLVYGDRQETVDPRAYAEALLARTAALAHTPSGLERHAAVAATLIDAGRLAQGLADAAFDRDGCDDGVELQADVAVCSLTGALASSWSGDCGGASAEARSLAWRLEAAMPETLTLREPEGFAFYAVYPELYLEAGSRAADPARSPAVIGLRSIGATLGPAAACGAIGKLPITLRPFGEPFDRRVRPGPGLAERLLRQAAGGVLVVDEGPGASGSSFGAVGDWLEDAGVPPDRVTYMPSHLGDLGPHASERHRARWRTAGKAHASFEEVILPRLPGWAEPLIGALTEPLRDLSGGLWRDLVPDAPAWPQQERRKYLAVTERGRFLLKFAGLGAAGARKLERARALHVAGLTAEPLGLVHGFLVERWVEGPTAAPVDDDLDGLGRYLGFRARSLEPPHGAASDDALRETMRRNLTLAGLPHLAAAAERLPAGDRGPPCAIDGRLHAWEWRRAPDGRLLKLDALDHCEAHDLVGAQDLAWDVAGARVEFDLSPDAADRLRRIAESESGQGVDTRRVGFQTLAYLAFQIGWWTLACETGGPAADAQVRRYKTTANAWRPYA